MTKRIIVLGTIRSGTSLTAELVRLWGAYAGQQKELWKSNPQDPRGFGYMEYIPLQEFNDELLDGNDRVPPPINLMEKRASIQKYKKRALELLRAMDRQAKNNQARAWVWKDARLPMTLPFWTKLWGEVGYIITIRHPAEVALSAAKAQEFQQEDPPYSAGLLYWQYCMLNVISHTQNTRSKMFIAYDQLLNNPLNECSRLCHFLDDQINTSKGSPRQRIKTMAGSITKDHRHYDYKKSLAEMEQSTREQRALYDFLRVKTMYPDEAFNKADFELYPGWMEYLKSMDMLLTVSDKLDTWATQPPQ